MSDHPFYIDCSIPSSYQNSWCIIYLHQVIQSADPLPFLLSLYHTDSQEWTESHYLQPHFLLPSSSRMGIIYIPHHCNMIRALPIIGQQTSFITNNPFITIFRVNRLSAAFLLASKSPTNILRNLINNRFRHIGKVLRLSIQQNTQLPISTLTYTEWCAAYDQWGYYEKQELFKEHKRHPFPIIHTKIYSSSNDSKELTQQSLHNQWKILNQHSTKYNYIAIIQNGETLTPHAMMVFAQQAVKHNYPAALYADSDILTEHNQRVTPNFKPNIGLPTLLSGILTQDIWIIREDVFDNFLQSNSLNFISAYTLRLSLGLYIWKHQYHVHHIAFILSHSTITPSASEITDMVKIVKSYCNQYHLNITIKNANFPLQIQFSDHHHAVSIIIPTTLQSKTIHQSIQQLIQKTTYPNLDFILVISQPNPLTSKQRLYLNLLLKYKNIQAYHLRQDHFNFSQSCNFGISQSSNHFIAIVNDDICPQNSNWLSYMMGHMQDKQVGAVGAKLYYPNGQIQHGGIIMGLANLCDHAGRFENSQHYMLTHDHDVSAVTGACMVIRRHCYEIVQGFNHHYEIAYNDIDFCLKLREHGFRVIQCQQAELIHYESLSLGNHYTGTRAGKERDEIMSMYHKWKYSCDNDPFYNSNLSLQKGMGYHLAFPPRISRPFGDKLNANDYFCK